MLNATIDRFAFESISLHDDQVAFRAKISIAKKYSRLHHGCCSRACRCAESLRASPDENAWLPSDIPACLEPRRFVQGERDDRSGNFRRPPPSSFANIALTNGALAGNVSSAGGRFIMFLMLRGDRLSLLNELGAAGGNEGSVKFGERRCETGPVRR